jgi:predicted transposase/invertase (TIGR01784 family)
LSYLCLLYLDLIKADKEIKRSKVLPLVLPIVLYSGKQPWNAPLNMDGLIEKSIPKKLRQIQPSFNYLLLDEGRYPFNPQELEGSKNLVLPLIALEQSKEPDQTLIAVTKLVELLKQSGFDSIKRAYTVYLKRVLKLKEVLPDHELNDLYEVEQMLAERVDAWIQRGIQQGMQQGIEKKAIQSAEAMLEEGCDVAFIAKITQLSLEKIKALQKELS